MLRLASRNAIPTLLAIAATAAALRAQGTPIGFEETFALSPDRAKAVAMLIPGTDDWYYYHCRERLAARDFTTVKQVLPTWIARYGRNARVLEIENRSALLGFANDPDGTFGFLRDRLGMHYGHQPVIPGAKSTLPTQLDPNQLSASELSARAFQNHPNSVDGFTDHALAGLAASNLDAPQLRSLLTRLQRPDIDNLPALIVRDLGARDSGGFGSLRIHGELRIAQLEQCLALRPALLQEPRFVNVWLARLQPSAEVSWQQEPAARAEQLARLWQFVQRLAPSFNSLKAHVLFHWLQHDLSQGAPDRERFLQFLRLPRRHGHPAKAMLERTRRGDEFIDPSAAPPTELPAIGDDTPLLRACLEHFFAREDAYEAYAEFLDADWLKGVFAETKILLGQGDLQRWTAMLADPARTSEIEKRVELRFPANLRTHHGGDDAVQLAVETKNVPKLLVKVFAIDAFRYHVEKRKEVDATIDLDGVVANFERTFEYSEPPTRRVLRTFDLPMLQEPGTWVVEFVGNGISSRAVIHKGSLRIGERTTAAGHSLRVYDEQGNHQGNATVWFGGREYDTDERGDILLPFSTEPGNKQIVLRSGNRSSMTAFAHRAETFTLSSRVHVEREALIAGNKARALVRPQLRLDGHPIGLALLQDRVLAVTATDLDGISTTQEIRDLQLTDERELVHEFQVPERLASLQFTLRGKVKDLRDEDVMLESASRPFQCNGIDATAATGSSVLLRTESGYAIEWRGKNGEPLAGRTCTVKVWHRDYRGEVAVALQTDASGRIQLGELTGITELHIDAGNGTSGDYVLDPANQLLPETLHGLAGDTLQLPYTGAATTVSRAAFSLLSRERDEFEHLALVEGFLELRDLAPGDYTLTLHEPQHHIQVRITRGNRDGGWLLGQDRTLEQTRAARLHVPSAGIDGAALRIQVANMTPDTRVHVIAARALPAFDGFAQLADGGAQAPEWITHERAESSYHAGRKLGDEYRYVLERRFATKYAGNLLARPSLLLNPWQIDASDNAAVGIGGGVSGRYGSRGGSRGVGKAKGGPGGDGHGGAIISPTAFANLDWLPRGAVVLANLVPGADGVLRVPLADLGDGQHIQIVALDNEQAIRRTVVRAEAAAAPRSRALPQALDGTGHFVEQKRIEFVATGGTATIDDPRQAQVEVHDSLAGAFRLFTTISRDAELAKFAFLLQWPTLSDADRQKHYDTHACHELHFFLFLKDRAFFDTVCKPLLGNKLEKTFLDHWLLGDDLRGYLEPWAFEQLNLIERILLSKRLGGDDAAGIVRSVREAVELRPVPRERLEQLFTLALRSEEMAEKQVAYRGPADLAPPPASAAAPAPGGPVTGGPAGPAREMEGKKDDKAGAAAPDGQLAEPAQTGSDDFYLGQTRNRIDELGRRASAPQLYRTVQKTKLLVEHDWWHRRREQATADIVAPNRFWLDYATAPAGQPFASAALVEASTSTLEMLMALAVLDLPFTPGKHEVTANGNQRTLRAASPLLLVRKEVAKAEPAAADQAPLLLGQNCFRLDDRYRFVDGERRDAFVSDEFLVDVAYGCQVVVTNPTSQKRTAEVLLQIPAGALPVQKGFWTKGVPVTLEPYATATVEYAFYFPAAGDFAHYPAHAAERGKLAANAQPRTLHVVPVPTKVDTTSWEHISQQGTTAEVLAFLDGQNIQRLDITKLAWRMRDREVFTTVLAKLRSRHVYDSTLWSYSLLHRDVPAAREYLQHADGLVSQCGMALQSPLLTIDPRTRGMFQQLELDPLVHPRAHQLGGQRVLGNADLARQYASLMTLLGYHDQLDSEDWLVATYYLLLQDRIEEGIAAFGKVDVAKVASKLQYDYLAAYLCFFTGDLQKARQLAERHQSHPVPHWQQRFKQVLSQLDEAAGVAPPVGTGPADLAATAPALDLALVGRTVTITAQNLPECEVRYYELDVEFAFSAQPFAAADGTGAAFVRPNLVELKQLQKGAPLAFELPAQFAQKNVLVEVRAGGLVRSKQSVPSALDVKLLESAGQLAVTAQGSTTPLSKVYVKVFAKLPDGTVRFHKDGYTDLRGRFDYASLSDDPNLTATRYAVLVLDEQRGAVIREVTPPAK